jgi:NAD(P)H dehydrogenase (quinone)
MTTIIRTLTAFFCMTGLLQAQSGSPGAAEVKIKVLIAYYSAMGHTAAMAKAVDEGARKVPGVESKLETTSKVQCKDLLSADAVIVGSPVYWSNMAAEVKAFYDRWTHECNVLPPTFDMKDKIGAAFVTAGEVSSGKETTLLGMVVAMLGNRMIVVSEGDSLGATATTGEGKSPVAEKDLEQARRLGERVARLALQFKRGKPADSIKN